MRIARWNNSYSVDKFYAWMREPLTGECTRYVDIEDPKTGKKAREAKKFTEKCYIEDPISGQVLFPAGLLDEFLTAAEKHGISVEVVDGRNPNPNTLTPQRENIPETLRYKQDKVIDAIINNDKGIILCNTGFGKSFILRTMCMVYPTAKIVICTAARNVVKQIYNNLVELVGKGEVGLLIGGTADAENSKRITVATCASIQRADLGNCDFLFFDEVHNIGFNKIYEHIIQYIGKARMFGFTASLVRGDGALKAIKSLFGKKIAECSYQEAVKHKMVTPIKALMPKFSINTSVKITGVQVIDEKLHYWRNYERNAFFAKASLQVPADQQLLITVKTLEHAIYLRKQPELANFEIIHSGNCGKSEKIPIPFTLDTAPDEIKIKIKNSGVEAIGYKTVENDIPGFNVNNKFYSFTDCMHLLCTPDEKYPISDFKLKPDIIGGVDTSTLRMTKKQVDAQLKRFATGELKRAIATTTIKEGGDFHHLAYIFRADGSSSGVLNVQFPGRASRLQEGKEVSFILDPFDTFNEWVKYRALTRYKYYKAEGWIQ